MSPARPALRPLGPWPTRAAWFLLPVTVGPALAGSLDGVDTAVRWLGGALAWGAWAASLLAVLVPHPLGLTVLRILSPTVAVVAAGAAIGSGTPGWAVLALAGGAAAAATGLSPGTADRCVDGSSYGPERRMALRVPLALLLGPLPLAWAVVVTGTAAGPLLLAAGRWVAGVVVTVLGLPAAAVAARAVHGLSLRFVVFVPAGLVVHDRATLHEPILFSRDRMARLGPAVVGSTATDLTAGATGLVLQIDLTDPVEISRRTGRRAAASTTVEAVLITPVRPGALLREASGRRLPVG